jgi:hypothetical protein
MNRPRRCRARPLLLLLMLAAVSVRPVWATSAAGGEAERRLVNDLCPVMEDEPASPLCEVQFRGVAVRFCCSDCRETFTEDPAPYLSRLPQLPAAMFQPASFDPYEHASVEWAAGWVDRWARPVLLILAGLIACLLVLRIVRRTRLAHAGAGAAPALEPEQELHPATGPRVGD